ncbi:MAG: cytochrome c biogenesis protein [Ignavibacteria bacterium]|nr:cytochrome c biogenesis protein [Ignavibacteria bacterium]MBT8382325.1 cytochrome c biogenesis protein [Ignavibacteria bacterium]MBT8390568.1 cytochrome c biogenesis protein [Ignavibacteria bacterium]NNL20428.1 cytochrome c biogenesis protein CcsA [Ignavibacteriaceae bacterium]
MVSAIHTINILLPVFYLLTLAVYFYDFIKGEKKLINVKRVFLFITLFLHLIYIVLRTVAFDHPPITNVFEIFTILAITISFSYFLVELVSDIRGTGPFIIVLSFIFQLISSLFIQDLVEVKDVLRSNLLGTHVISALLGYSGFTISAVYGFLYLVLYKDIKLNRFGLIFNRLPNLEMLERLSLYSAVIGFITLTIAIIIGIIWLPVAFPNFSFFDPKIITTSLVWVLYGIGITSKVLGNWRGKRLVLLTISGFLVAIISTILSNFLAQSFHSFY